jgi:hypothetical protein
MMRGTPGTVMMAPDAGILGTLGECRVGYIIPALPGDLRLQRSASDSPN